MANSDNKQDFICMLSPCLKENKCNTINAKGDADVLIVKTAVKCAENREEAFISEDIDLLVLLCYHANLENNRIFFQIRAQAKIMVKRHKSVGYKEN